MTVAKVHPQVSATATSSNREVFTVWMKSLIMSSNGCAVFDSNGRIVYRVDNYDHRCRRRVLIMNDTGKVLITIVKKNFGPMGMWEGNLSNGQEATGGENKMGFRVRRNRGFYKMVLGFMKGYSYYKVVVRLDKDRCCEYVMESHVMKPCCRIVDTSGSLVAEMKRKVTKNGVVLGEDVLGMVVEPNVDHRLIMGLVVVFGLLNQML